MQKYYAVIRKRGFLPVEENFIFRMDDSIMLNLVTIFTNLASAKRWLDYWNNKEDFKIIKCNVILKEI